MELDESAWRGLPLTWAQGNDVHTGSNIAFSLADEQMETLGANVVRDMCSKGVISRLFYAF